MPRTNPDRINPWLLVAIAIGLMAASFLCYTGHPLRDSNLYSAHAPGWIALVMFILIGVLWRLLQVRIRKHDAEEAKRDAQRKDLTKR